MQLIVASSQAKVRVKVKEAMALSTAQVKLLVKLKATVPKPALHQAHKALNWALHPVLNTVLNTALNTEQVKAKAQAMEQAKVLLVMAQALVLASAQNRVPAKVQV